MQAAETDPPEPGAQSSAAAPWKHGGLIALPSPIGAVPLAMAFTQQQRETLSQLVDVLAHLAHLADQSRQIETPDSERQTLNSHFHERAASLSAISETTLHGEPIFGRADWAVDLAPHGNKLIIPGIYRGAEQALSLRQTDLLSSRSAAETHQRIMEIFEWLGIDHALVTEIQSRLHFAASAGQNVDLERA